jgi:16S rRNA (cytidine1402-2'-O)-methyltransferase
VPVLYIIATPIGNLDDITFRALATLRRVALVAAEDTRRTLKLLTHFDIRVKLLSCRAQNEEVAAAKIAAVLRAGDDVAFVSDSGTPALSDPGAVLVKIIAAHGYPVLPIPGASAFAALLSVAGLPGKTVVFEGFLSPKNNRRKVRLSELLKNGTAFVLYESPFRILKLLTDLAELDKGRYICVGREMTKLHEEYLRGTTEEVLKTLSVRGEPRGEFAVFVGGQTLKKKLNSHLCFADNVGK